jgi:hypothetical protein
MAKIAGLGVLRLLFPNGVLSFDMVIFILILITTYVVVMTIYSVFFHPLAGIPGPKLCAITRIPYWQANFRGNDVAWLHRLHTEYGPMVRFGPTDLSFATGDAWKDVHGHEKGKPELDKAPEFSIQPVNGMGPSSVFVTRHEAIY